MLFILHRSDCQLFLHVNVILGRDAEHGLVAPAVLVEFQMVKRANLRATNGVAGAELVDVGCVEPSVSGGGNGGRGDQGSDSNELESRLEKHEFILLCEALCSGGEKQRRMMMRVVVSGAFPLVRWERAGVGAVDERCFDTST